MKVITTNLLNRFWKNGIKPVKDSITTKLNASKVVASTNITQAGFVMDGKTCSDALQELNSNLAHIGKSAVYYHTEKYNLHPSASADYGTAWQNKIIDSLGIVYVPDSTNYKNGFRVPFSGNYRIDIIITFHASGWKSDTALYGYLNRNGVKQQTQIKNAHNYRSCTFSYINGANANDLFTFTLLQNSGGVVAIDGPGSRFNITYLGT